MTSQVIHARLQAAAVAAPARPAIVDGERSISYGELDDRSDELARLLVGLGVQPGDRVGLHLEKSIEALTGIYAILKAGAAYVPLDSDAPPMRLGYIARNCELRCLLSAGDKAVEWGPLCDAGAPLETIVVLDEVLAEAASRDRAAAPAGVRVVSEPAAVESPAGSAPRAEAGADDVAYILYTSGSTGEPKGVTLTHRNALAFVDWAVERFAVGPQDRLSSHAPLHFDLSIFDLYAAVTAGATLVLVPAQASVFPSQLARFIAESQISVWYSVPSILTMLALRGGLAETSLPHLRTVLFAGEVFPTKHLRRLMGLLPGAAFVNLYGPTETNVCTYYEVPSPAEDRDDAIPIGRAIDGVDAFAVTDEGALAEPGEVGELHVGGPTVMRGYWGDGERSERALVPDPRGGEGAVYRTGDLVVEDPAGDFLFLGRRDSQVKSRGYRIELGEIERALEAHEAVVECAVVAIPDDLVTNRIKAFVAVREPVEGSELARFCAQRVPRYMVPESFALQDALPKTSTGKIDRRRLAGAAQPEPEEAR